LKKLPYVEALLKRGFEVLFMVDTYDEYTIQALPNYKEMTLKNAAKGGITFDDSDKEKMEADAARFKPLCDYFVHLLKKRVEKVTLSQLLDKSPMAVVANNFGWSPAMEKLMNSNSGGNDIMASFFRGQKKLIEINPNHPLMEGLLKQVTELQPFAKTTGEGAIDRTPAQEQALKDLEKDVRLLYDASMLHSGYELKNPAVFAHRVEDMIRAKYGVAPLSADQKKADEQDEALADEDMFGGFGNTGNGMGDEEAPFSKMADFDPETMNFGFDGVRTPDEHAHDHDHDHDHDHSHDHVHDHEGHSQGHSEL